jgi:CubicO group peptidase (beta-lactamase class C family)
MGLLVLPVLVAAAWAAGARATAGEEDQKMVFPEKEWATADPKAFGFDTTALEEIGKLIKKASANSMLVCNGRVVAQWYHGGSKDKQYETQSITKSFLSIVLGLSLEDKLVPSLDTPVRQVHPAFEAGPHTKDITFRHLATMTSGIKPTRHQFHFTQLTAPGTMLNYHADQCAHLARALTYVNRRPLMDVLKERILDPIGASGSWDEDTVPEWSPVTTKSGKKVPVNVGFAFFHTSAPHLARVGHLFLNGGKWKDTQLLSAAYVKESWTVIPQKPMRAYYLGKGYGLYWWQLIPGIWFMSGTGGQFCLVWPEYGIVMTKVNAYKNSDATLRDIFRLLYRSVTGKEFAAPKEWNAER